MPHTQKMIVAGLCSAAQLLADSEASIAADGLLIDAGRDGKKRNPALSSKIQALGLIRAYAAEIGLSPASASRLPLPPVEEEKNPFTELLERRQARAREWEEEAKHKQEGADEADV